MKRQIRILGIDDSPFNKFKDKQVLIIGTIYRGGDFFDGILSTKVAVDGSDSTRKLTQMINKCKFKPQLKVIMLDGIAMGGFNIVDVKKLSEKTKLPVIVIMRDYPDLKKIKTVLKRLGMSKKIKLLEKAGEIIKYGKIHIQLTNIKLEEAKKILKISCTNSFIPEPLRAAHIIGAGVVKGESKGNA
jgi:endonuclease V-like protein UPF0215 family